MAEEQETHVEQEPLVTNKGPATRYRPKDGGVSVSLSRIGKDILKASSERSGQSQSDVVEELLRRFGDDVNGSTSS